MLMDPEEPLDFPEFEEFNQEDRPPPPDVEDYPVGCYVELVDAATARQAQTEEHWQPFLDTLFRPKRRVLIKRHMGDYTFVLCDDDPECLVGAMLYRACLKEPKVKMRKYIPQEEDVAIHTTGASVPGRLLGQEENNLDDMFSGVEDKEGNGDGSDIMSMAIAPPAPEPQNAVANPLMASRHSPLQTPNHPTSSGRQEGFFHRVPVPPALSIAQAGGSTHSGTAAGGSQTLFPPSIVNVSRSKRLVRNGNKAFAERKNEVAIKYYTEALELDRSDAARILSNRSAANLAARNAEAALSDARAVMRIAPRSHVGYVRAGNVFRQLKRFDEARMCYEKALALDPGNSEDLQYSLVSNAVAAIYRAKTEHLPVSINLGRDMRITATSKRSVREGDVAWSESTSMVVPASLDSDTSKFCRACYRSLLKAEDLASQIPGVELSTMQNLLREVHPVACHESCGHFYCSDQCRAKAWTEHHWIECEQKGRWSAAMPALTALFAEATNQRTDPSIIASVRLTLRMMIQVMSSSKPLPDAVCNFSWLPEKASLSTEEQSGASNVLQPAYMAVHECLTREERALLDLSFAVGLYKRCRENMVPLVATPWPNIVSRAESHLSLIRERGENHPGLSAMTQVQPTRLIGAAIPVWAIFEIYAVLLEHGRALERNVSLRRESETVSPVAIYATRPIERGAQLVGGR